MAGAASSVRILRCADAHAVQERLSAAALRCSARRCGARLRTLRTRVVVLRLVCAAAGADGEGKQGRRVDLEALRRERAGRPPAARQPPTPPRYRQYASNLGRTNGWTAWLNAEIQACASAEAVLDLVSPQLERLSAVNACTALITIQRRARGPATWLQDEPRFAQLLEFAARVFERMEPRNLSNSLYACGKLGVTPPADWLERFWQASVATVGDWNAQDCSNTIYACGQLRITPPADLLERFWIASGAGLGAFVPQALSNTIYSCGQLGITPPGGWLESFWHASAAKLSEFDPQELSNSIYACGLLAITPPADWLQRFSSACEQALPGKTQQNLANTALALAMLEQWELPLWRGLWERLCSSLSRNIAGWSAEDQLNAMQIYQAYQAAAVERPNLLPVLDPELHAAIRKSWIDQGRMRQSEGSSQLHDGVSACLMCMGVAHANERWCDRAERSIDVAIEGATPIALEVDGPSHFLQDGRSEGRTLLRNRMLAAHGWRVVVVNYRVWQHELKTGEQREQYLRSLLA